MRGLRYPVATLLELLASGMTVDEVLEDYPDLERDDVFAALEFGAMTAGRSRAVPRGGVRFLVDAQLPEFTWRIKPDLGRVSPLVRRDLLPVRIAAANPAGPGGSAASRGLDQ